MRHLLLSLLFIAVGCNVAKQPSISPGGIDGEVVQTQRISFNSASYSRSETSPVLSIPYSFALPLEQNTNVTFSFSGSATAGVNCMLPDVDYVLPAMPRLHFAGTQTGVLDITVCNDDFYEGSETIVVTVQSTSPAVGLGSIATTLVTLEDSLPVPSVSFAAASSGSIPEGAFPVNTPVTVVLELSHRSTLPVSVQLTTSGTATLNDDYMVSPVLVSFAPKQLTRNVTVTIFGDDIIEPNESVVLGLFAPVNAGFGAQGTHSIQIAQDEAPASVVANIDVLAPASQSESVTSRVFPVTLTGQSSEVLIFDFFVNQTAAITATQRASYPQDFSLQAFLPEKGCGQTYDHDGNPFTAEIAVPYTISTSGLAGRVTVCPLVVPPVSRTINIPVLVVDDATYEPSEAIVLTILGGPLVTVGGGSTREMIIAQSDVANRPLISFLSVGQNVAESNTAAAVVIRLQDPLNPSNDRASGEPVTVYLTPALGTTSVSDWSLGAENSIVPGTRQVIIPPGQTRITVPFTAAQDGIDEENETLTLTLSSPGGYSVGTAVHAITILDSDPAARVNFQTITSTQAELGTDPRAMPINIVLDRVSERTVTVFYQITGTATVAAACGPGVDLAASGSVVIPPGTTLVPIGVQLCLDTSYEGSETARFAITSATNAGLGGSLIHNLTITDDEPLPLIALSVTNAAPAENAGSVNLVASITNGVTSQANMVIPLSFAGTAVRGTHYQLLGSAVTIPAGQVSSTPQAISLIDNAFYGGDRTIVATMGNGPWSLGVPSQTITINDDEPLPQLGFTTATLNVSESVGQMTGTIRVNPGFVACEGPLVIALARGGTATAGADHDFALTSVEIPAKATSVNFSYNIINDNMHEPGGAETLTLTMTSALCEGANLLLTQPALPATQTVNISDDDPVPVISYLVSSKAILENDTAANAGANSFVVVRLDRPSSVNIDVTSTLTPYTPAPASTTNPNDPEYSRARTTVGVGQDISVPVANLTIPAGATSVQQALVLVDDNLFEYTETASLTLSAPVNGVLSTSASSMQLQILNDDPLPFAHLSFVNNPAALSAARSVIESNVAAQNVFLLLSNSSGNGGTSVSAAVPVVLGLSVQGTATVAEDYTLAGVSGTNVIVPAGASSATFTITHVNDTLFENDETVRFATGTLQNGQFSSSNAQIVHTITADADAPPVVSVLRSSATVAENAGSASFTIQVAPVGKAITLNYTVSGTATAGQDHTLSSGTLNVLPSTSLQSFPLSFSIINDTVPEADETIVLSVVASPPGDADTAGASNTITIEVSDFLQLAAGSTHTCGLLGGLVKCWGEIAYLGYGGSLVQTVANTIWGDPGETVAALPYVSLGSSFAPIKIAAGDNHTCALGSNGQVKCWGANNYGQLGLGLATTGSSAIIGDQSGEMGDLLEPVFLGTTAIDIAVGNNHSCALLSSGRMKCWGRNHHGQLGQVRSGASCADAANTYCIGDAPNEMGALAQVSFPVSNTVSFIAAGDDFTCALLTNGRIYCFGVNNLGQLGQDRAVANWGGTAGDMTDTTNFLPIQLHPNFNSLPVLGIVGGGRATCAVFQNDALLRNETLCWGGGIGRPAPDTPLAGITAPVNYYGFGSFTNLRSITAGTNNVCVRGTANEVLCWDRDTHGQLGNGGANTDTSSPHGQTLVNAALVTGSGYLNLTTGPTHSCSAVGVNQFKCWGLNSSGQLGNASTTSINSPLPEAAQSFD